MLIFFFIPVIGYGLVFSKNIKKTRYEMVGFSHDFKNFKEQYEKKVKFISENLQLVQEHFEGERKIKELDITGFKVEALFIVNTPTFYVLNGTYNAIMVGHLDEFITSGYRFPEIVIKPHDNTQLNKKINHPYFTVQ